MIEYKILTAARVPVRLLSATGSPVSGIVFGSVSASVEKSDGTVTNLTVTGADWAEITTGSFSGVGKYDLIIPSSATDLSGVLTYVVKASGCEPYVGVVKLVAYEEVDTKGIVDHMRRLMEGKWAIYTTGINANSLVLYAPDGTTPLQKWDLFDKDGNPATTNIYTRVPTESIP